MAQNQNEKLTVRGIVVDSINEKNVAVALDKLGYEYAYQKYLGAGGIRGTSIIDFLVYTVPKPTPLFVHGAYSRRMCERNSSFRLKIQSRRQA